MTTGTGFYPFIFAFGELYMLLLALLIAGWRECMLALSVAMWALLALMSAYLPESPEWLEAKVS